MKRNVFIPFILLLILSLAMNTSITRADDLEEFKTAVEGIDISV